VKVSEPNSIGGKGNNMEYTKGTWEIKVNLEDNCIRIYSKDDPPSLAIADVYGTHDEDLANARLIAAAPELYEAVKQALRTFEAFRIKEHDPRYMMLMQALLKAEGK
jgi:hypothetical protein